MGTIIKATGISTKDTNSSSNYHAIDASAQCLIAAGINKTDIDVIINVGVYRDKNMLEPAMAAFIQKGVGIKGDYIKGQEYNAVFSLDMLNSACGVINAIQAADSILRTKKFKYALIASSDAHPSTEAVEGFPFSCIGAALLLEYVEDESRGFKNYSFGNSKTSDTSVRGFLDFSTVEGSATNRLTIAIPYNYQPSLFKFTCDSLEDYLVSEKIDRSSIKMVTPQINDGFAKRLAAKVGVNENSVLDLYKEYGDAHSSSVSMGYHLGVEKGMFKKNDQVMFVAAGTGLSFACVTYTV